jgi:hypothetical protein
MFSFERKKFRQGLRSQVTRIVVAALLGSLLVPFVGITAPQILPTANAAPGSFTVTASNNHLAIELPSGKEIINNTAYTVEAFVKIDIATNPLSGSAQDFGTLNFSVNGSTNVDQWNQRTGTYGNNTFGSYYLTNNGDTLHRRCDGGDYNPALSLADCPKIVIPRGEWTHLALQKSVVSGTTTIRMFIDGKIVSSYVVTNSSSTTAMKILKVGPFGGGASTSKASYGQMRITAGSLYPTTGALGSKAFTPTYDWTTTVSGSTVSSGASVVALFKPQDNSTVGGLADLTGNGAILRTVATSPTVTASSDYAAPPAPAFTYSPASVSTFSGSVLPTTSPVSTGGDINSYSISPALPNGINLNTTTGVISGTPTQSSAATTYVVTGTQNSTGRQTTANVSITVNKPVTTITLQLANSAVQVGVTNTITATTSTPGNVSFQTDQGVLPGCSSVATTTVSPFTATCPWSPTSSYFTMNATLTPTNSELATSTSNPSLTNIRGSLSVTSTGPTTYPGGGQGLGSNNTLRLNFPEGTGLVTAQSFTIETWVKVNNPILNMDINAFYGNSFYGDRGQGISINNTDTRIYNFLAASAVGLVTPSAPIAANNVWQHVAYQRNYVPGNAAQSYDAIFINGVLVAQFANGGSMQAYSGGQEKSTGIRIGPFTGAAQIGPTQVLSGVAAYPLTGFSPATTFSFGANTLALFQPSSTSCSSSAVAPQTVTASTGTSTAACSTQYPVAPPSVTSVVANSGPLAGQNTVVITGTNFVDLVTNGLKFGSTPIAVNDYAINTFGTQITVTKVPLGSTGTLDVTVQTAGGTSSTSAGSKYTYVAAPTITSLSPSVGAEAGGIGVVITGTGFTNVSAVTFGSNNATSFTVNSSTRITANFPAGVGNTFVKVTTPGGTSAENASSAFSYTSATSVTSISPNTGSTLGGTVVEISGTNFTSSSTVVFGSTAATDVSYNSTTGKLTATSPAGTSAQNVRVTTGGSQSATGTANVFTYTAAVAVSAISYTFGPTTGGTVVEISGTNFTSASTVVFGTNAATNVSYNSTTGKLTATSPAGTGAANVRVTTAGTQSADDSTKQFTYFAPPTITGLSRTTGPNGGGSSVIITGTNFTSASTVAFGSTAATVQFNSITQLTATSPAGSGAVDVRVTNQGGTTENVVADNFTYFPLPVVIIISPTTGTTAGGTLVTITGENFIGTTGVKFGTADAAFTVVSATEITVTTPVGTGEVNVTVITPGGTSTVALYGKFTYVSPPTLSSISPASGMLTGGQDIIITGTGLNNLLTTGGVLFGTIAAQTVSIIDSTQIRVVTPATTVLGVLDIFLVNSSGSSVASSASKFTYTKSNDAKLSALTLSQGTLVGPFSPTTNTYTASVINSIDKVTVTPTVNQASATVQVKVGSGAFETVVSGSASLDLPLAVGANTILVKVTAHDETTVNTYTITLTRLSNDATLFAASIKAQTATLGTPNAALASVIAGEITLTTAQATGSLATVFTKTDTGATITRIVKYATGAPTAGFETDTAFANSATTAVANGDFFIVKVTAADGTVNYYRFNVTVNSDVATLSGSSIKGQAATLGTPNAVLASVTAGTITLTTAQATGTNATTFTKTDAGATITKIVKYATGASTTNFENDAAFTNGAATTVIHADFFIVKVTAADATVRFYRVNVIVNSNVATLSASTTIKGLAPSSFGTSSATLGSETPGAITLTTAQAAGTAATTFTKTDAGATINKIVKYASGAPTSNFEIDTAFANSATSAVANGDFFIIKVTAQDATVNYSRFNVTVNSNVATLSAGSIKGQSATTGTAGSTLGSLAAGAITLTTAQATGTDTTTFTKTDAGATITKIVKLVSSATENSTNFNAATAFTNGSADTVSNGDYFIIQVTAADATVSFTRFNVTVNSNIATLSSASIKGLTSTLGTPNAVLTSVTAGTITLTTAQATGTDATTFTKTDAGSTITRIVKYSSGAPTANFETDTAFNNSATDAVANGDFFIVKVTAADGTVNHYRFNVTVNSNVATLSGASIKGQSATVGTAGSALGSLSAGTVTLTTAQAAGANTTTFTKSDAGATITKIAKLAFSTVENSTNFNAAAAFTNGATSSITNGDYFIVQVTAADSTVNYTRFNVTINSNVATLSTATIKGFSATLGTPGTALGSLATGTVTLSLSQATGTELTTFTKSDAGATITKIAKLGSGVAENLTNFSDAAAFTNGSTATVTNGDYFIVQVTAADGTVNYYRFNLVFATNPTVPLNLSATAQGGGANLTWSAPTGNGGSALTGYEIQASTDSTTWTIVGGTNESTRQLSITTLNNGTAYSYRVRATNSSGDLNYNWATSTSVRSFYLVECSTSGSFYVNSTLSVVQIPSAAGVNCKGEVTIPQGIVQINSNAFTFNTETTNLFVTKVNLPATGLRTIDQGAFKNLGLTSVSIPATVETVGIYSFMNNPLTTVYVAGTGTGYHATALVDSAFKCVPLVCPNNPGIALTLGSGKIQIGENFGTGTVFSSVDWGTGITSIGRKAFYNVAAGSWAPLFPRTITQFDAQAFEGTGIKTIRFGTATTHSVTSINTTAFDTSINSVQYCGSTGTVLSNYINSRFTSKTIWCAEDVPNAPINLTATAGASGQVQLNWSKGAARNEAPTYGFDIRYSSDGGSTWSALISAVGSATSLIVPNLSNGTSYIFQIRAKNLFGESVYSANATATPLGTQINPTFGPSTSTADGFTVNLINYDASYTYSVPQFTSGSGTITVGTVTGSIMPITVSGMSPGAIATISINNQKTGFASGNGVVSGSALNAARVPVIGNIVTLTGGFTAAVTNYDSAFTWGVSSSTGTAIINTQGGITVSGVAPSTAVQLTVNATRTTYAPGSTQTTVTTLALLRVFYNGTRSTGGAVPTDANSYASNGSATVLANPASGGLTLNGYDFTGWSLNADESGQTYQPNATLQLGLTNITLYAKWTLTQYTVTYYSNGATSGTAPIDSSTYTMGGSVPISGNTGTLARAGYSFIGWGKSSTDTVNQYVSGNTYTVGTNNIAFWARWSANTYRVTFDANGGTGAPSKAFDDYTTAGTAISLATRNTLAKSGYNFAGWGLSAVSTPVADPFTTAATIDLYAQWTVANFAVTYVAGTYGSGSVPTQANVNYGTSFTVAAATGLTGSDGTNPYAFVSWSDGTKTYAPGQSILMGAGAVTLTAQWTRIYNVTYSFNGGSVTTPIADQQKIAGDTIVISSVVPERAGYIFASWKDQSGETAVAGANYEVRANNYLLYAQWTARSFTITYDVNGGNTSPTQTNKTIGQIFTVAAAPAKVGHDFEHWSDGTNNYNPGADYQVGISNVILQAIWTPQVYQISYNFNGGTGTPITAQNYTYGTGPATLPASGPSRFEFNFLGWATTPTATAPVSASFAPSGNIMMHAVWVTSVYRLTFNAGIGVSDSATATVTIGQSTLLPGATRANYNLQGWSTTETGGTLISLSSPYTPIADAILYAQWVAQIFTVTYNGNGGTAGRSTDSVTYNVPTPITLPSATRANYVFSGWYSQASGGFLLGDAGANYSPTTSVTAYARWIQGSLYGMGPATLIAQLTVRDGLDTGFTAGSNGSKATVAYTAGALPDGTVITAFLEDSTTRVSSLLQTTATPILSLVLAWVAPDGTVPDTVAGKPIVMTVSNSSITAGSKVYGLVANQPEILGVAQIDGQVQVSITKDPVVVVAMVAPDAPTGVTATAIDSTSATISWTAPVGNGGSAINGYTARSNSTQTCTTTSATSCIMTGLVTGTAYTFTVVATNGIGTGAASSASAPLTLSAPTPPSVPSAPVSPPSVPSGTGSSGSGSSSTPTVNPVPVVVTLPVVTSLTFVPNATKDGGKLVWVGSNIEAVLFTGDSSIYPTEYNYGAFSITWTGDLINIVRSKTYTAKMDFRSASGGSVTQSISFSIGYTAEEIAAAQAAIDAKAAAEKKALDDAKAAADKAAADAIAATKAATEKAAAAAKAAAELKAAQDRAAAEAAAAAALKAAKELADAQARAAAELKAAQDKAAEDARIAAELKAAQEKADADLKAAAEKKALQDAATAAALAAKKIVPKISLYSISSKLTLSAYDNAYLKKYISTLKSKAVVTCIGYYYTKNTTIAKAKALATSQATAICKMIKKAKPTVITKVVLYSSTKAPKAAQGAKWVAISYRVDSFKGK